MDRFIAIVVCWPLAVLLLKYREQFYNIIGDVGFAEKFFGVGGTHNFIILLALGLFIFGLMYALGTFQALVFGFLEPFI